MSKSEAVIPVVEEEASIETRIVPHGRVRVETKTDVVEELVKAELETGSVDVRRVPVGRMIDRVPEIKIEEELIIVPVVEEILVVERRLMLKEELHIRQIKQTESVEAPVLLRKQRAVVTRMDEKPGNDPERSGNMSMEYSTANESYSNRSLTAFFDDRDDAEDAVRRLKELGIVDTSIRLVGGEEYRGTTSGDYNKGFWESLADFFFPEDDRAFYAEGLRRGGYLVTVSNVRADLYEEALDILDDEGSINLDERAASWRSEGWSGNYAGASDIGTASAASTAASDANFRVSNDGDVIPVVEERLRVGKRDVNLGRVRVRSYVVEEPVSEDVSLREDRVRVERRPVDRPLSAAEDAFTDKVIEAEEHAEEAVVSKDARVREEIALRREETERTETVSDTVRRTEVEVEDDRAAAGPTRKTTRRKA